MIKPYAKDNPKTVRTGLQKICKDKKYGFIASDIIFLGLQRGLPCSVLGVPHAYYSKAVSMAIQKNSPFKRILFHQ